MSSKPMPWLAIRSQADRHAVLLQLSAALRSLATCRISIGRRPDPRLASSRIRFSAKGATVDATFSRVPDLGFFGIGSPFETALAWGSASDRPPFLGTRTGRCKVHARKNLMVMETQAARKGQAKVTWRDSATLSGNRDGNAHVGSLKTSNDPGPGHSDQGCRTSDTPGSDAPLHSAGARTECRSNTRPVAS